MRRLDNYLIRVAQDIYLYVYDRTGLTVGMLIIVWPVGAVMFSGSLTQYGWLTMIYLVIMGMTSLLYYYEQMHEMFARFNARAEYNKTSWWRTSLLVLSVVFSFTSALQRDWMQIMAEICWVMLCYTSTLKIRKREPPETLALQPQGAR